MKLDLEVGYSENRPKRLKQKELIDLSGGNAKKTTVSKPNAGATHKETCIEKDSQGRS